MDNLNFFHKTKDQKCNYYYFAFNKGNKEVFQEHNSLNSNYESIKNHIPNIEQMLKKNGPNMCSGVEGGYILEQFRECDYVLVVTEIKEKKYTLKKKTYIDNLCGLVFLKENAPKDYTKNTDYLYISLICSNSGVGSHLMKKSEEIARMIGVNKIKLDSLDTPIGFYLYKGYKFDRSSDILATYEISKQIKEKKPNKKLNYVDIKKIPEPKLGYILTQKPNKNTDEWIVVQGDKGPEYMYLKPGYIKTYKRVDNNGNITYKPIFSPEIMENIRKHKDKSVKNSGFKATDGFKVDNNAGVIKTLKDVSTYKLDREGVSMTKVLDNLIENTHHIGSALKKFNLKRKKLSRKKQRETIKRSAKKSIRYLKKFLKTKKLKKKKK